jgi:hypothetical protein
MSDLQWPFDQPPDCAAITLRSILFGGEPILHVTHDKYDLGWQFLGAAAPEPGDVTVVGLEKIAELDPSVLRIAHIPPGWHAWRGSKSAPWLRARIEEELVG